jgi:hypothetical protein
MEHSIGLAGGQGPPLAAADGRGPIRAWLGGNSPLLGAKFAFMLLMER